MIVVKRQGIKERFDERKVYGSIYGACTAVNYNEKKCERIADAISKKIRRFVKKKKLVSSTDIRKTVRHELEKINKELAFFYEKHLPNLKKL